MAFKEVIEDRFWEYENFLTPEEISTLLDIATSMPEAGWRTSENNVQLERYDGKAINLSGHEVGRPIIDAINERISKLFTNTTKMIDTGSIIRGSSSIPPKGFHKDNIDLSSPTGVCECTYGIIMYLNDDFTGGEIVYPDLNVEYMPKAGVLIAHRADELHGVNEITSGIRYSMTAFMWGCDAQLTGI
jgi:hypothetical protein